MITALYRYLCLFWFRSYRADFYDDFSRFCMQSVSFVSIIFFFYKQAKQRKKWVSVIYRQILSDLKTGSLVLALSPYIPPFDSLFLSACEAANSLSDGLSYLAILVRRTAEIRRHFFYMVSKNLLPICILIFLQIGFCEFVVPLVSHIVPQQEWPWESLLLKNFSFMLVSHGFLVFLCVAFVIMVIFLSLSRWRPGPVRFWFDQYMPIYRLYRQFHAYSFLIVLSQLLMMRMSLIDALLLIKKNHTPWMSHYIGQIIHRLSYCSTHYGEAFQVGILDQHIEDWLIFAAEQNHFAEVLIDLGHHQHRYLLDRLYVSVDRVQSIWLSVFAVLIIFTVLGFYDAIYLVQNHIS